MSRFRKYHRLLLIIVAVLIADVAVRLIFDFHMRSVVLLEAVLFAIVALVLTWSATRDKALSVVYLWLAVIFGLGSLRAVLWSAGVPVGRANLVVLVVGALAAMVYGVRRLCLKSQRNALGEGSVP